MLGSVWIDADPGLGLPVTDVDDALAIAHLAARQVPIAGLSTCFGNAGVDRVTPVARALSARLGRWPVVRGASCPGDVDTEAVDALVAHRGTVLALAPLTNIAAALSRGAQWTQLIVLGGTDRRLPNIRPLHTTELNFAVDEAAAAAALRATTTLFPMEPCRRVWFRRAELSAAPGWLRRPCRSWLLTSPPRTGRLAFHPWDLLPAMWLTHPQHFGMQSASVTLRSAPAYRGRVRYGPGEIAVARTVDEAALRATWRQSCERLAAQEVA